jgi:phosphate-selective porin
VASIGLNWYPLAYARLMVEALDITVDDAAGGREEARAIQARLQLHFTLP